ncbi:MAG: insulinase family protein [Chitinophagaceae bacterium]|nr:insulinase family protein [Chitinophagaceae bacterium]
MITFEKFTLSNGLRVIVHQDTSTPMAAMTIMYDVGARDEDPEKTGFAHLFEHLMFCGSENIPEYDPPLQMAGGENNAYTTNDFTAYHLQLPARNLETAFWLESDRMLSLAFSEKSLDIQRKVVCEEFREMYLNKPYGDVWHKLRALAYTVHPYRWMTIGKDISHIENATLDDVKSFFFKYYRPANAVLAVAGNVTTEQVRNLCEKWFADIPSGLPNRRNLPQEPEQQEERKLEIKAGVPLDALYKAWHMASRLDKRYYITDLITDILGNGASSRLYQVLVKEKRLFSQVNCYHSGNTDPGLVIFEGRLVKGVPMEQAEKALEEQLQILQNEKISETELQKVKNKTESMMAFEDVQLVSRANSLAYYELLGNAEMMNEELSRYHSVSSEDIQEESRRIFNPANCSTVYYFSNTLN